ncbi:MAG: hypothetical protein ICV87_04790, partial [Gemmatimonadetes bacterium]|nr:hypothetical protein [Gemmatimonadota bacterium]
MQQLLKRLAAAALLAVAACDSPTDSKPASRVQVELTGSVGSLSTFYDPKLSADVLAQCEVSLAAAASGAQGATATWE